MLASLHIASRNTAEQAVLLVDVAVGKIGRQVRNPSARARSSSRRRSGFSNGKLA